MNDNNTILFDGNPMDVAVWLGDDFVDYSPRFDEVEFLVERMRVATVAPGARLVRGPRGVRIWDARWDR